MTSRILAPGPAAETTRNVAVGQIGDGFGPYAYAQNQVPPVAHGPRPQPNKLSRKPPQSSSLAPPKRGATLRLPSTNAVPMSTANYDAKERESSEATHEFDPEWDNIPDESFTLFSLRGWINVSFLVFLLIGIITLFAGYPVISHFISPPPRIIDFNLQNNTIATNSTGNGTDTGTR